MDGAIHPSTSKVLAISAIMTRLVGVKLGLMLSEVDIVSVCEFHSTPNAFGWWTNRHLLNL